MQSTQFTVTMFLFCILSESEKVTSSIKQGLRKMFTPIIFCQVRFTEFRTRQFKSFSNSKYLAIAFSINFKSSKLLLFQLCTCSGMCLLLNWKIVHCGFICIFFRFVHAPVCANCTILVNCIFFKKKKQKKKKKRKTTHTLVWVKIPKLCHNTPLSIFSLGKGGNPYVSKPYIKTKYKCTFCPALNAKKIQTKRGQCTSKLPKICIFFPSNFAPIQ